MPGTGPGGVERYNRNRSDSIRKYLVYNYEIRGNHMLMRQIDRP